MSPGCLALLCNPMCIPCIPMDQRLASQSAHVRLVALLYFQFACELPCVQMECVALDTRSYRLIPKLNPLIAALHYTASQPHRGCSKIIPSPAASQYARQMNGLRNGSSVSLPKCSAKDENLVHRPTAVVLHAMRVVYAATHQDAPVPRYATRTIAQAGGPRQLALGSRPSVVWARTPP